MTTSPNLSDQDRELLIDSLAARIRDTVWIHPGPNAKATLAAGDPVILSGREAEYAARAALAALDDHDFLEVRHYAPTQDAYDAACRALDHHRRRAAALEAALAVVRDLRITVHDDQVGAGITPAHLQAWLDGLGWVATAKDSGREWRARTRDIGCEALLPLDPSFVDYGRRVMDLVSTVAAAEGLGVIGALVDLLVEQPTSTESSNCLSRTEHVR